MWHCCRLAKLPGPTEEELEDPASGSVFQAPVVGLAASAYDSFMDGYRGASPPKAASPKSEVSSAHSSPKSVKVPAGYTFIPIEELERLTLAAEAGRAKEAPGKAPVERERGAGLAAHKKERVARPPEPARKSQDEKKALKEAAYLANLAEAQKAQEYRRVYENAARRVARLEKKNRELQAALEEKARLQEVGLKPLSPSNLGAGQLCLRKGESEEELPPLPLDRLSAIVSYGAGRDSEGSEEEQETNFPAAPPGHSKRPRGSSMASSGRSATARAKRAISPEPSVKDQAGRASRAPSKASSGKGYSPDLFENASRVVPAAFPSDVEPEPASAVVLVQLNQDPREQWVSKFLERTRTTEAKVSFRNVLGAYTLGQLEYQYFKATQLQKNFVAKCRDPRCDPELRAYYLAYLTKFPGIPGEVGLEDVTR
jgi:hypothetical protein